MSAVFTARDARQRQHLLKFVGVALDDESRVAYVAGHAFEGDATSVYLFSFYDAGLDDGMQVGIDYAVDRYYGRKASDVAARTKARQARRARKRNRSKR